jgi:threonine dehydrogenase-like Zn-dependent dehydrogenase
MRALVIDGPGSASLQVLDAPAPGSGQVVVDVHLAGICGTDMELFTGGLPYFAQGKSRFPLCPGHEWCGVVSAVGAGVDEEWLGERVTGDTMIGCGHCRRCASGRHHVCANRHEIGITDWPGALAEKVLVPADSLYKLPPTVGDRAGALVEPAGRIVYIGVAGKASAIDSRDLVLNDITAIGILGASAGLAPAIEHYADGRVDPGPLVHVVVGLDRAVEAFDGRLVPEPGTKIHIDPRL